MRGFALIEVLVATGIVAAGLVSLAQLMAGAVAVNAAARHDTVASMLAAQKVEELRTGSVLPIESVEQVDAWGRVIGSGESRPPGATHTRRWTIRPVPSGPPRLVVIDVTVEPLANARGDAAGRRRGLVRVSTATSLVTP